MNDQNIINIQDPEFAFSTKFTTPHKGLPPLKAVIEEDLTACFNLLNCVNRQDSYSTSMAYYAMTGRKGLWRYGTDESFMMIARHPNKEGQYLAFPPMGSERLDLIKQLAGDYRFDNSKMQLARYGIEDNLLLEWGNASKAITLMEETILDWQYPVHILNTENLVSMQGSEMKDFRKNISRAQRNQSHYKIIETEQDIKAVENIALKWAQRSHHQEYDQIELIAPTIKALSLLNDTDLPMRGVLTFEGKTPVGFMIWEESKKHHAVSIAGLSIGEKGASEYTYHAMAQELLKSDFHSVCIGGSEEQGLDQFKRKMNPIQSVTLTSAQFC